MAKAKSPFATLAVATLGAVSVLALTACGGGTGTDTGGGQTFTVACASGVSKTSTLSATDYSVCPTLPTAGLTAIWAGNTGTLKDFGYGTSTPVLTQAKLVSGNTSIALSRLALLTPPPTAWP